MGGARRGAPDNHPRSSSCSKAQCGATDGTYETHATYVTGDAIRVCGQKTSSASAIKDREDPTLPAIGTQGTPRNTVRRTGSNPSQLDRIRCQGDLRSRSKHIWELCVG